MTRLVCTAATGPAFPDRPSLEEQLADSVAALEHGARFVEPSSLPTALELNTVHARLARLIREATHGDV